MGFLLFISYTIKTYIFEDHNIYLMNYLKKLINIILIICNMESFNEMLNILYCKLADEGKSDKVVLDKPILNKVGTKMVWTNAKKFLRAINRDPTNFIEFVSKETNGNANWKTSKKSDGIIFSVRINNGSIEKIMRSYSEKYVKCGQCGGFNSIMSKDNSVRKFKITCLDCNSIRYV